MKIIRLALDVLFNRIDEDSRDIAYSIDSDADWVLYIRGYIDPVATRELIIEETYNDLMRYLRSIFCKP